MDEDNRAGWALFALFALLLTIVVGGFFYLRGATYDVTVAVIKTDWQRTIHVESYRTQHMDTDEYLMPADAYNVYRYTTSHYHSETCTSGSGKSKKTYECGHTVTDYMARYDINRWVADHDLTTTGGQYDDLVWPVFKPDPDLFLGAQREGSRQELFTVHFSRKDNNQNVDFNPPDHQSWTAFSIEQRWTMKFNRLEQPLWETLKKN